MTMNPLRATTCASGFPKAGKMPTNRRGEDTRELSPTIEPPTTQPGAIQSTPFTLVGFDTKTVSTLARRMSSAVEAVMAGPSSERWLEAHRDPLADIYTFSSCVALSDLTGQIIKNVTIKSKIYQGTATTAWLLPTWAQEIST